MSFGVENTTVQTCMQSEKDENQNNFIASNRILLSLTTRLLFWSKNGQIWV